MRRTSLAFRAWTLVGFLTLLAVVMFVLWLADVPDLDLVFRVVASVLAFAYWPGDRSMGRASKPTVCRLPVGAYLFTRQQPAAW